MCCAAHGGCLLLYRNYPRWKCDFEQKMSTFPLLRCGVYTVFLVLHSPEGQKGRQSPQTMVTGTAACARSRTARRRSSASCVTSGKGRQPGKKSRGQRAGTCTTAHAFLVRTVKCTDTITFAAFWVSSTELQFGFNSERK